MQPTVIAADLTVGVVGVTILDYKYRGVVGHVICS